MSRFFSFSTFYPRAREERSSVHAPATRVARRSLLKASTINFFLLQVLFLCLFAYLFGALYVQDTHIHKLNVVYVDYDGGLLGDTVRNAYKTLQGNGFPTLIERLPSEFATPADLRNEVCETHYWAAIYTSPGASNRLQDALVSHSSQYDKSNMLTYVWNEVRFPTTIEGAISASLQTLSSAARIGFASRNWTDTVSPGSTTTFSILADPWHLTSENIQPTTQGARTLFNTIMIVLLLIQEFFFLGTINALSEAFRIYARVNPRRVIIFRAVISAAYTLSGSLCVTGMIWAFRENWNVDGRQFGLTWMIFWLFTHINILVLDSFTIWLPPPLVPMGLITWVVLNVASILVPYALTPGFYHWGYSLPAHNVYDVLGDIWSRGCNPKLHYALPILFSWEVIGLFLCALGVHKRAHFAIVKAEAEEKAFQLRLDNAMTFEHQRDAERRKDEAAADIVPAEAETEEEERKDMERIINQTDMQEQKLRSNMERGNSFGPSFGFNLGLDEADKRQ